jgi:hypothetical protein
MLGVSPQSVLLISAMAELTGANCQPAKPLPILMINGTADQLLPYAGGLSVRGDSLWSAERLVGFFRRLNGCAEAAQRSVLPGQHPQTIEVERTIKCPGGLSFFIASLEAATTCRQGWNAGQLLLDFFRQGQIALHLAMVTRSRRPGRAGRLSHRSALPRAAIASTMRLGVTGDTSSSAPRPASASLTAL